MGQGSDTAMSQVVAEVFGLEAEDILIVHPDTDVTPYDMATLGSRSTFHMGNAVKLAAEDARRQMIEIAAKCLGVAADQLRCEQGGVVAPSGAKVTFFEIMVARFQMQAGNVVGFGAFTPTYAKPDPATGQSPNVTPYWMVNGVGAEVEVDTETGRVKVTKLVNVGDVGRAINPATVKRQLTGAAAMQLGITLFEEMLLDGGQVVNASFGDYKISGILDVPADLTGELVEVPHEHGPFGAKGCGESGSFGISPAIANALFDAVGVRMMDAPFTPERVLRALREQAGAPLGDE